MPYTLASLSVDLAGPLDFALSLAPLGRSGDDGLDRWDGQVLVRTLRIAGPDDVVPYLARPAGSLVRPRLEAKVAGHLDRSVVADAIAATLTPHRAALHDLHRLGRDDAAVGALTARYPGLVPVLFTDPLTALIRSISAQQVNLGWAAAIRRRIALAFGRRHAIADQIVYSLHAEPLAGATTEQLRALQLTRTKAASVIACARAAADGRLVREELALLDDEALIGRLTLLPGIGRWSAEWFLARTLGRPRVVAGDLGVRKAVGRMYAQAALPDESLVRQLTAHWGAAASLVQALALHALAEATSASRGARTGAPSPPPRAG